MSLGEFFEAQVESLRAFLVDPAQTVRIVRTDPEMRPLIGRLLARIEDDPDDPNQLIGVAEPFQDETQYLETLTGSLAEQCRLWGALLEQAGIEVGMPGPELAGLKPAERFTRYASKLADAMPEHVGALAFVLDPSSVSDPAAFRRLIAGLADGITSDWAKLLVLDDRQGGALDRLEDESDRIGAQTFHLAPEEIERRVAQGLASGRLDPAEHRRYLALSASFAFSKKRHDEARKLQEDWLARVDPAAEPGEAANALFNLGNTLLASGDFEAAEVRFGESIELALTHGLEGLLPMALTNLGVTLHRLGRLEQSLQSFTVARETCRARGLRPGEAHALDCQAMVLRAERLDEEAERCWLEALAVYEEIEGDAFTDVREGGSALVLMHLEEFYRATRQKGKLADLERKKRKGVALGAD